MNNELYHFGIEGMRWGIRRYQNKDGSLTELGKRRLRQDKEIKFVSRGDKTYIDDSDKTSATKGYSKIRTEASADNIQLSKAGRSGSESSRTASGLFKRSADRARFRKASRDDLSKLSDKELREIVNRMNMERQYRSLKSENIKLGRDRVADALGDIGDIIAIGANVASIAAAVAMILK